MERSNLERPFHSSVVERAKGRGGQKRYVGIAHYIRRLNQAFDGRWSFDIVEHQILESEVIVLGRIRADGIEKTAFGGSVITKKGNGSLSVADDLKAASSDALKKAASLFGVGLDLYSQREPEQARSSRPVDPGPATPEPSPTSDPGFPPHIERLVGAAEKLRWSRGQLAKWVRDGFGVSFSQLSREQTEEALSRMRDIVRGSRTRAKVSGPSELEVEGEIAPDVAERRGGVVGVGHLQ